MKRVTKEKFYDVMDAIKKINLAMACIRSAVTSIEDAGLPKELGPQIGTIDVTLKYIAESLINDYKSLEGWLELQLVDPLSN